MSATNRPRHRTTINGVRLAVVVVSAIALVSLAACSTLDRDEPATVTLPEHDTTTTQPRDSRAPGTSTPEPPEAPPIAWKVQVGGPGDDRLRDVTGFQQSVVAVGSTGAGIDIPVAGASDVLSIEVSTEGEVLAVEQAGSPGSDDATSVSSSETSLVTCGDTDGAFGGTPSGGFDLWCAPIDPTAVLGEVSQLGGPEAERAAGVALGADDSYAYVAGSVAGLLPGAQDPLGRGLGGGDALALQTDATGRPLWARQFGTVQEDAALGATTTADDDGILVGYTDGDLGRATNGARDAWISRFDATGNQRWLTQVGSTGNDSFVGVTTVGEARRGTEQFIAGGTTDGDLDGDGPDVLAGATDAAIASFGTDGTLLWTSQFGSAGTESVTGVVADGNTVYVAGTTDGEFGTLDVDGGEGGGIDVFLTALDAVTGDVLWTSRFGTPADESVGGLTTTEDGLLVVSGATAGQLADTPANGGLDGFLVAFPLASAGGGAASSV